MKHRKEILGLISKGFTHRQIQEKLGIGLATISRVRNIGVLVKEKKHRRVLIIGDLHAPFIRRGYLEFCKSICDEYKCTDVVFTGDILDNHFSSFWDSDPDGSSAGDELEEALTQIQEWVDVFPIAMVCIGNHDRLPARQAFKSGVSTRWVRDYNEVLGCPEWEFAEGFDIDGVRYEHGEGAKPHIKMLNNRQSYVCGHTHSELSIKYSVSEHDRLFAMQVGWGGDQSAYAMAYAKNFKKGIVSCGLVLKNGTLPLVIPMPLMKNERPR